MFIYKRDVVRARASFCSLDETQKPPNGYNENTVWILGCAFALAVQI